MISCWSEFAAGFGVEDGEGLALLEAVGEGVGVGELVGLGELDEFSLTDISPGPSSDHFLPLILTSDLPSPLWWISTLVLDELLAMA